MNMDVITLIVGDLGDGHEKKEETSILCNLTNNELEDAFTEGEKIIGIRFSDQFSDYRECKLPASMIKKMSKFFDIDFVGKDLKDSDYIILMCREYLHLWLKIAKVGNPQLVYEICKSNPYVYIGGYGLFE